MLHSTARAISSNGFLLSLAGALLLGWLFSAQGAPGGLLRTEVTTKVAVILIFFFNGLTLQTETVLHGLARWKLHVFIQLFLFVFTPLLFLIVLQPLQGWLDPDLRIGFLYLAILPCTISTAVVLAVQGGGNHPAALFNATLANVIGVFLVPIAAAKFLAASEGGSVDALAMLSKTVTLILPSLVVGQLLRPTIRTIVDHRKRAIGRINTALILFIVYAGFAASFAEQVWSALGTSQIAVTILLAVALCVVNMAASGLMLKALRLPREDAITGFFCSTLKTLAAGAPMAYAIFPAAGIPVGPILIPLLCFVAVQFSLGGIVVDRIKRSEKGVIS